MKWRMGTLLFCSLLLSAGCVNTAPPGGATAADSAEPSPTSDGNADGTRDHSSRSDGGAASIRSEDSNVTRKWRFNASGQVGFDAGVGPAVSVASGACDKVEITVPAGATRLTLGLSGKAIDSTRLAAGYIVLDVFNDRDGHVGGGQLEPREEWEAVFERAAPGPWSVVAYPMGGAVNQFWDFTAEVEGEGASTATGLSPSFKNRLSGNPCD